MAVNMQTTVFQKVIPRSLADSTNVLKEPSASNVQGTTSLLTWRWQQHVPIYQTLWRHFSEGILPGTTILGTFTKLQKVTISFVMSVRPTTWNNSVPTGQIVMKFDIGLLFKNLLREVKFH